MTDILQVAMLPLLSFMDGMIVWQPVQGHLLQCRTETALTEA